MKRVILAILALCALCSCGKWTETKSVDVVVEHPWDQNSALWEEYLQNLVAYKASSHYIFYALYENNPASATSEASRMRSLPDSLDFVALTNADNFSEFDAEDMEWMNSIGTKVLYRIDLDSFADASSLSTYLDKVIASVADNGLAGYALAGTYILGDETVAAKASTAVSKLSAAKKSGQYLTFEGNPSYFQASDRASVDYFILDTWEATNVLEAYLTVKDAENNVGVAANKILLASALGSTITDETNSKVDAPETLCDKVVAFGPLAGFALDSVASDYYHADGTYTVTRSLIHLLNP